MSFYSAATYSPSLHHHHGHHYTHYYSSHMPSLTSAPPASTSWWRKSTPICTPDELTSIIVAPSGGMYEIPTDPYNEVYPGVIIGDGTTALCLMKLKSMGITHVLNAAFGKDASFGLINTSASFYASSGIKFLGVEAYDMQCFDISPFFNQAADFIDQAVSSGGKCYVHCKMGISRSATLVLAFLMIKRGMSPQEAMRIVRSRRQIIPNNGFLKQLCRLADQLNQAKGHSGSTSASLGAGGGTTTSTSIGNTNVTSWDQKESAKRRLFNAYAGLP